MKTKMTHTPGPWNYVATKTDGMYEDGSFRPRVVYHIGAGEEFSATQIAEVEEGHESDARLIAAAPELLAELKKAVRILKKEGYGVDSLDRLIAKAEGRE